MPHGHIKLPKMEGAEIAPGIFLIGEPKPVPNSMLMQCLANVHGALCVIELKLKFGLFGLSC